MKNKAEYKLESMEHTLRVATYFTVLLIKLLRFKMSAPKTE